ncbi:probable histone-lysine N-methyltransferase set-23 [Euwallacea fornicatus]|uniref:probable histone-lysine N-methyltransferase set-23 n=1 Tax=Euwallacea fornicatus TaxID=995702 RepID=UPI00338FB1FC
MDCTDNYFHLIPQIMYFPRSIPTKEVEKSIISSPVFCNCDGTALCYQNKNCNCTKTSGSTYLFSNIKDLESYKLTYENENKPTYECNEQCRCSNHLCGNKLVQCGPRTGLEVKQCNENKGFGLFTGKPIKNGNFVCEYAGEIISAKEASSRFQINTELKRMNYIFCINEYFGENNLRTFIDPTFYGNIGRYVNHSCEPNCVMISVRVNDNIPVLALFASKDIAIGQELSYNYGMTEMSENRKLDKTKCLCGSTKCTGFLPCDFRIV